MAEMPANRKYTKDHEWALLEGDVVKVGISDYAQHELGDIVFVELSEVGTAVEQGKPFGSIEAVKTVAELFAPVTGTVCEVNNRVQDDSSLVNSACYHQGWLVCIRPNNINELEALLDAEAYKKLIAE